MSPYTDLKFSMTHYNTSRYWGKRLSDLTVSNLKIGDRFLELSTGTEYVYSNYFEWKPLNAASASYAPTTGYSGSLVLSGRTLTFVNGLLISVS